jgi:hypothetical protein
MRDMEKPVYIFYHLYCKNNGYDLFLKTFNKIKIYGLLNEISKFFVVLVGPDKNIIYEKLSTFDFKFNLYIGEKNYGEMDTLDLIYDFSLKEDFNLLYLHSKGASQLERNVNDSLLKNVEHWTDYLEYFCIKKHHDCLEKLKKYDICSTEWKTEPYPHFAGNFWWANSSYVRNNLKKYSVNSIPVSNYNALFEDRILDHQKNEEKLKCEFWISNILNCSYFSFHQTPNDLNLYQHPYFIQNYMNIQKNIWPHPIEDRISAWKGLENYIIPIMNEFNIQPNSALEFGVDYGYSTKIFSKIFKKVIGVDTFLSDEHTNHEQGDNFYYEVKNFFKNSNIDLYRMNYKSFIKNNNDFYDLIHIDIIHTYQETYECTEWAVNHSNVVILHDTVSYPAINKVCEDLRTKYNLNYYNITEHCGLGILFKY